MYAQGSTCDVLLNLKECMSISSRVFMGLTLHDFTGWNIHPVTYGSKRGAHCIATLHLSRFSKPIGLLYWWDQPLGHWMLGHWKWRSKRIVCPVIGFVLARVDDNKQREVLNTFDQTGLSTVVQIEWLDWWMSQETWNKTWFSWLLRRLYAGSLTQNILFNLSVT